MTSRLLMFTGRSVCLPCLAILVVVLLGGVISQAASAEGLSPSSEAELYSVCPPESGHYSCMVQAQPLALTLTGIRSQVSPNFEGGGELKGLDPANLRQAYNLPETGGSGQAVAIVDAYNDPKAEANLAVYREKYGLGSCTRAKVITIKGEEEEPKLGVFGHVSLSWTTTESLEFKSNALEVT
jgi:subtilase family serine protease